MRISRYAIVALLVAGCGTPPTSAPASDPAAASASGIGTEVANGTIRPSCTGGAGFYCGRGPTNGPLLFYCKNGDSVASTVVFPCNCQVEAANVPDHCVDGAAFASHPDGFPGSGWWCGGAFGRDPNTLYFFAADTGFEAREVCPNGCHIASSGNPDSCN